eukprot:SAG31_NODE_3694_length_3982_cov_2.807108_2_plen_506_part_00
MTGHSRGGHGALMIGVNYPDRCMSMSSLSGWYKREYYGDANPLFVADIQLSHLEPGLKKIFEAAIAEHDAALLASNLAGVPTLERVGSADKTISPWYTRRMARLLDAAGSNCTMNEIRKDAGGQPAGHWWWDTKTTNDGGVINDKTLRGFVNRNHHFESAAAVPLQNFVVTAINPATQTGSGGFRILQQRRTLQLSTLRVNLTILQDNAVQTWEIQTSNVQRFRFAPVNDAGRFSLKIDDGAPLVIESTTADLCTNRDDYGSWHVCPLQPEDFDVSGAQRGPNNYGPSRRVFMRPFAIVVGTASDGPETRTALHLELARYVALSHFAAVGSYAPVVLDTELDPLTDRRNLVLLGGPSFNTATAALHAASTKNDDPHQAAAAWPPVIFDRVGGGYSVGDCVHVGPGLGLGFVLPLPTVTTDLSHPEDGVRLGLVLDGSDAAGLQQLVSFSYTSNQPLTRAAFTNMFPDFILAGPDYEAQGYGGVLAAGFWGPEWNWSPATSFAQWC